MGKRLFYWELAGALFTAAMGRMRMSWPLRGPLASFRTTCLLCGE